MLKHANLANDYNYRENYIDRLIEETICYFSSSVRPKVFENVDMVQIMKHLRKNNELIALIR